MHRDAASGQRGRVPGTDEQQSSPDAIDLQVLQQVLDAAGEEMYLLRSDATLVYANAAACNSLGRGSTELCRLGVAGFDPGRAVLFADHVAALQQHGTDSFQTEHIAGDGRRISKKIRALYVHIGTSEYICWIGRCTGESRLEQGGGSSFPPDAANQSLWQWHTQTAQALRQSEIRFRTIFEQVTDGILVADTVGSFHHANRSICHMLGYSCDELLQMKIDDIHPPEALPTAYAHFQQLCEGKIDIAPDVPMLRRDGSVFYADISGVESMLDGIDCVVGIFRDVTRRRRSTLELEERVVERTLKLTTEIEERKRTEAALRKREQELETQTRNLQELNTALKVVLNRRDHDLEGMEQKVVLNVRNLVLPYIEKLRKTVLTPDQASYLHILENSLSDIVSPFLQRLSSIHLQLTPAETRVAVLIREGKNSREIAECLCLSKRTIDCYRDSIRRKLGLKTSKTNLRSYLLSLGDT